MPCALTKLLQVAKLLSVRFRSTATQRRFSSAAAIFKATPQGVNSSSTSLFSHSEKVEATTFGLD